MNHDVDARVGGVGSVGTITGLSRYFQKVSPQTELVLADPVGSVLAEFVHTGTYGEAGSWLVEGIGEDFIPPIADLSRVKKAYSITDQESATTVRELLVKEAILAGSSTGTLLATALRYCREQTSPKRVVTFVCDSGTRYLSKVYNDNWMFDQGLLKRQAFGDLRDIIGRRFEDGNVVSVAPSDTLATAFNRMRNADISQLPVIEEGRIVGIIDESDLLLKVTDDEGHFTAPVADTMSGSPEKLSPR